MKWVRLQLEVVTPIFSQGESDRDGIPELRVSSIIGATRYWLRALTSGLVDDRTVRALERRALGGVDGDRVTPSALQFRVYKQPEVHSADQISRLTTNGMTSGIAYLCGQGLYSRPSLTRGFIPIHTSAGEANSATLEFRLRDRSREAEAQLVLNALWMALCIGGIGARTRRGFGGLKIVACEVDSTPSWVAESWIQSPPYVSLLLDGKRSGSFAFTTYETQIPELVRRILEEAAIASGPPGDPSDFPTIGIEQLSFFHTRENPHPDWQSAASSAGRRLREFRACNPAGARRNTPEWEHTVLGEDTSFPLGLLGYPVNFMDKITGERYEANVFDEHDRPARRASPIWLRFVSLPANRSRYVTLSFAFANRFAPGSRFRLVRMGASTPERVKELSTDPADLKLMFDAWCNFLDDPTLTDPNRPMP